MPGPAPLTSATPVSLSVGQFYGVVVTVGAAVLALVVWALTTVSTLRAEQTASIIALRADMVSKAEFSELKAKIDTLTTSINQLNVTLATMTVRLENQTKALEDLRAQKSPHAP